MVTLLVKDGTIRDQMIHWVQQVEWWSIHVLIMNYKDKSISKN